MAKTDDILTQHGKPKMLKITLWGSSFVYNQIRKMIGTVIGILHGKLPDDYLALALKSGVVLPTPLCPAEGLMLANVNFKSTREGSEYIKYTTETKQQQDLFMQEVMLPHIVEQLDHSGAWEEFFMSLHNNNTNYTNGLEQARAAYEERTKSQESRWEKRKTFLMEKGKRLTPGVALAVAQKLNKDPQSSVVMNVCSALEDAVSKGILKPLDNVQVYIDFVDKVGVDRLNAIGNDVKWKYHTK